MRYFEYPPHNTGTRNRHEKLEERQRERERERETRRREGKWIARAEYWESRRKYISHHRRMPSSDQVAKMIYQEKTNLEKLIDPQEITKIADAEMWWDKKVKTVTKIEHNRPDMLYWDKKNKQCEIIEISVPLDNNMQQSYKLKQENT